MSDLGKLLIFCGGGLMLVGLVVLLAGHAHLRLGHLPGDIIYHGKNTTFYFPIVTCILLSIVVSLILWLVGKWGR